MQIAAQHSEAVSKGSGISMEEGLLLDGVALHSADVTPRDIERAAAVEPDLADARLTFGDRATMPAGVAANAVAIEFLDEVGIGLSNALIQDVA
jgi:hypothetical protein